MSRTRQFRLRGKLASVEEVADLFAIPACGAMELEPLTAEAVVAAGPSMSRSAIEALQRAGWVFFRSSEPPAAGPVARVFVKANGRPVLGTNRLTVKVADSLPAADAEALFAEHGCRIVGKPTFAPGLYEVAVEPPAGMDVFDVAEMLDAEPVVEFAEPEFLEVVGQR